MLIEPPSSHIGASLIGFKLRMVDAFWLRYFVHGILIFKVLEFLKSS